MIYCLLVGFFFVCIYDYIIIITSHHTSSCVSLHIICIQSTIQASYPIKYNKKIDVGIWKLYTLSITFYFIVYKFFFRLLQNMMSFGVKVHSFLLLIIFLNLYILNRTVCVTVCIYGDKLVLNF